MLPVGGMENLDSCRCWTLPPTNLLTRMGLLKGPLSERKDFKFTVASMTCIRDGPLIDLRMERLLNEPNSTSEEMWFDPLSNLEDHRHSNQEDPPVHWKPWHL